MARRRKGKPLPPGDPRRKGIANLKPIKPGEVRNPTGKNGSEWLAAFREFASEFDSMPQGRGKRRIEGERAELVRKALFLNAITGDTPAQKIFIEQLQGRPRQSVEVSGPDGGPIPTHAKTSAELRKELAELLATTTAADEVEPPPDDPDDDDDAGAGE